MRSSAIFLLACLSAAIAKPVDLLNIPTSQDPVPPLNQVFPGIIGSIENVNVALDDFSENKVQSPGSYLIPESPPIPGLNTLWPNPEYPTGVEVTSSNDEPLASYPVNIVAQQVPGGKIGRKPTLNWDDQPTFEVGAVLGTHSHYHLEYPEDDGGLTSLICYEENLACCQRYESLEARFANGEGSPFSVSCQKCMFCTNRLFLVGG